GVIHAEHLDHRRQWTRIRRSIGWWHWWRIRRWIWWRQFRRRGSKQQLVTYPESWTTPKCMGILWPCLRNKKKTCIRSGDQHKFTDVFSFFHFTVSFLDIFQREGLRHMLHVFTTGNFIEDLCAALLQNGFA